MLDDECRLPKSSDEKFASRLYKTLLVDKPQDKVSDKGGDLSTVSASQTTTAIPRFSATTTQKRDSLFCIHHYAGPVVYSTASFVEKNKDELPKEAAALLGSSTVLLLSTVYGNNTNSNNHSFSTKNSSHNSLNNMHATATETDVTLQSPSGTTSSKRTSMGANISSNYSVGSQFKEQLGAHSPPYT